MKATLTRPTIIAAISVSYLAMTLAGCVHKKPSIRLVDVSVTRSDGQVLSSRQLDVVLASLRPELLSQGIQIAGGRDQASEILFVRFTPAVLSTEAGHISILGIQPKPRKTLPSDPSTDADRIIRASGP